MYDDVKRSLFTAAREIVQNFRSTHGIIEWVNEIFGQVFDARPGIQPRYIELDPHPEYPSGAAVSVLKGVAASSSGGRVLADDVRRAESDAIASLLRQQIEAGSWQVRDEDGKPRQATWRDVVVLIPARAGLDFYQDAFVRAGIPHRHDGGRVFYKRQEVRELIAILRSIDDPGDGVATVAALRSSAFGCSDEELFLHRTDGRRFDYRALPSEATGPVADALRVLRDFSDMRHDVSLAVLVRTVLDRTRLVEFAMLQPHGEQVAANLLKVIDQARAFAAEGGGLRGFAGWLKQNVVREIDETDAAISEETDDVVRILTVHAAKGLEFPIVVFANMNTVRSNTTNVVVERDSAGGRFHLKLGAKEHFFATPGYDAAQQAEQDHEQAESLRLLYVAATRARDRLVVPFFASASWSGGKASGPECLNDWMRLANGHEAAHDAQGTDAASLPAIEGEVPVWRRAPEAVEEESVRRIIEERESWQHARAATIDNAAEPLRILTATALKPEHEAPWATEETLRRGRAADFGSAVHALLERIDLQRIDDVPAIASAVAAEFGLPGREVDVERVAINALKSDAVARALASGRILRETPFTVPLGGGDGFAEGRIDLLFEEAGELVIVDFKTDAISATEVDGRADYYRSQALTYAWAAGRATGLPVREVIFLFASVPLERSIVVTDDVVAEAGALLA
jgi:ATP-dependent exoDNAse (exonuclease V) beta subunit